MPGFQPRLRKAYVAARLSDRAGRQTRARRSVAKEAWAKPPFGPWAFGALALGQAHEGMKRGQARERQQAHERRIKVA